VRDSEFLRRVGGGRCPGGTISGHECSAETTLIGSLAGTAAHAARAV